MSHFLDYRNIKIHFTDEGKGNAIVLLHGFLENLNMWHNIKPHLLKHHRVIAIDLLGHGLSESLGSIHTMETMADAVITILKHLKLEHVVLIGHSMGGYVSLAFAEQHPEMIKGICLMNSTSKADSAKKKRNRDRAITAVKQNHKTFIRIAIPSLFAAHNRSVLSNDINKLISEAIQMTSQGVIAAIEGMKRRPDRTHILKQLKVKKLIIVGKQDPVLEFTTIKRISEITHSILVDFPDGHMSHIENFEEFTYILIHFIEK